VASFLFLLQGFIVSPYLPVHGAHGSFVQLVVLASLGSCGWLLYCFVGVRPRADKASILGH
jgi:hypothetical protein